MIVMKNIARNNKQIVCEAYIEDCSEKLELTFDEQTAAFAPYVLPKGYEWCEGHIAHALRYLKTLIGKDFETHDRTIMWY